MSPYTFLPGLGNTTTVHLPPASFLAGGTDNDRGSVLLSFTAELTHGGEAGNEGSRVEVWTDAGTVGEWRAVAFSAPAPDGDSTSTSTSNTSDSSSSSSLPLVAYISLPIKETSFGYTYRIQHDSGDVTWLGDMGCNGRVEMVRSSAVDGEGRGGEVNADDDDEEGLWNGDEWPDFKIGKWTGFGVHVGDRDIPHGVFLSESGSTKDLAFAYIHPSSAATQPPFATFHPTPPQTPPPAPTTSITSTGIALLPPSPDIYLSTSTASLKPVIRGRARGEGTAAVGGVAGQPAAYASYCGVGFAGGEGDRSKAFRSLFARYHPQQGPISAAVSSWAYLPRVVPDKDEKEEGRADGHAVALVGPAPGPGTVPKWMVAYVSDGSGGHGEMQEQAAPGIVQWDCSVFGGDGKIAFWNAEERCASSLSAAGGVEEQGKPVVSFPIGKAPFLKTLEIVHLFEMKGHAGSCVLFGTLLPLGGVGVMVEQDSEWTYEPEKVEVEEYYVDEQVMAPSPTPTSTLKAVPESDAAPGSADSGVTGSTTSPGSSELGDETSVTSIEEVLDDSAGGPTLAAKKQQLGKKEEERDGYVLLAAAPLGEEEQAPMTGDLHAVERGDQDEETAGGEQPPAATPGPNDTDTTREHETTTSDETASTPSSSTTVTPRKSFFRFLWLTLGLFQSLYFRAMSWFKRCLGGSDSAEPVVRGKNRDAAAGTDGGVGETSEGNENEETPLLKKDSTAADYASTSERTLPGGYTESTVPHHVPQEVQEPAPQQVEEPAQEPALPQPLETIRVLEKRTIVLPAYIHTRRVNAGDLFLLTSLRDLDGLVAEIGSERADDDNKTSYPSWTKVAVVQETVTPDSEMRLVKISGMESDSHLRIRLV